MSSRLLYGKHRVMITGTEGGTTIFSEDVELTTKVVQDLSCVQLPVYTCFKGLQPT